MRKILILTFALFASVAASAQQPDSLGAPVGKLFAEEKILTDSTETLPADTTHYVNIDSLMYTDEYLDTVKLKTNGKINNYSMIGVGAGVSLNGAYFNPNHSQRYELAPGYFNVMFTHYEKMFDYLPYFGFQIGLAYGTEGYHFKENKETHQTFVFNRELAEQTKYTVVEVPFLAQIHYDANIFKIFADFGLYGGYRLTIDREGPLVVASTKNTFYDWERRWDYGLQGGLGFGLIFAPFEFHLSAQCRFGWSSFFDPQTIYWETSTYAEYNKYYYRYAFPLDFMISASLHFHLTKRYGKTVPMLRKEAKEHVYGTTIKTEDKAD